MAMGGDDVHAQCRTKCCKNRYTSLIIQRYTLIICFIDRNFIQFLDHSFFKMIIYVFVTMTKWKKQKKKQKPNPNYKPLYALKYLFILYDRS